MIGKDYKKYSLLNELFVSDILSGETLSVMLDKASQIESSMPLDIWDYYLTKFDRQLGDDEVRAVLVEKTSKYFIEKDKVKFDKILMDNETVRNAYYKYYSDVYNDETKTKVVNLMLAGKTAAAENVLHTINKNVSSLVPFSDFFVSIVDAYIKELKEKAGDGKVSVSKKVSAMILDQAKKLHAAENMLINQKLKELK